MHDSNHTDDFEQYLRDQVSEHRMYPSDRVWRSISGRIHTPKKWPALSVFIVLIISGLVVGTLLNKPIPDSVTPNFVYSLQSPANTPSIKPNDIAVKNNEQITEDNYSIDQLTSRTIIAATEKIKTDEAVALLLSNTNALTAFTPPIPTNYVQNKTTVSVSDISSVKIAAKDNVLTAETQNSAFTSFKNIDDYLFDVTSRLKSILNTESVHQYKGSAAFFSYGRNENFYTNFDLKVLPNKRESLAALDKLGKSSSRFDFRFYAAPSVSYRRLDESGENSKENKNAGASLESDYRVDPSTAINQSPALGYETGVGLGYKLNKRFSLTGGFQFNISQYKINAFLHTDEVASVILDEGEYASTVNTVSNLRSIPGTTPLTIKNRYYQLSMPLGLEWQVLRRGHISWGLGASVQPTYTFDKQPLIISSNYKNYADGSAYVRNWNINANAETFLGYTTGSYRWQIGPQVRYQMLPSLVDKYPNKEYLFNYGLKIGVVKQLK
ncbi:MAG TPA: hypothetical protein VFW07_06045 [Parafilimonas sp.]|nr:hypothetical protein [Parafilimonas sp.]